MPPHITVHSAHVAVITGISEIELGKVDAATLRGAVAHLDADVATVVIADGALSEDGLQLLLSHGRALATGRASDDAVKRVAEGRVVGSLDRRRLYAAVLPVVADRQVLDRTLRSTPNDAVALADLAASAGSTIALVDASGQLIATDST
jgi:2-C-methyl-D-erythritol 4-phosphate cytidylyltransferase